VFYFLDGLRASGDTNMWGAGVYLEMVFGMNKSQAKYYLLEWMKTFAERHSANIQESA
jgi:hypothetical protein